MTERTASPGYRRGVQAIPRARARTMMGDERGETVLGSALLFPIILFGLFMVIQILLGFYVRSVASAAATDAAVLLAQENATDAQARDYATNFILDQAGGLILPGDLVVTPNRGPEFTTVTVTGRTRLVWSVGLDASATAPTERFEPQEDP